MTASARLSVEDWNRLNRLLEAGLALDAANRSGWLETLPPESAHLHPLLEKLLAESQVTGFADDRTPPTSVVRMASDAITAMRTRAAGRPHRSLAAGTPARRRRHGVSVARAACRRRHAARRGAQVAPRRVGRPGFDGTHRARARYSGAPCSIRTSQCCTTPAWATTGRPFPRSSTSTACRSTSTAAGDDLPAGAAVVCAGRARRCLRACATGHPSRPQARPTCWSRRTGRDSFQAARLRHLQADRGRRPAGRRDRV